MGKHERGTPKDIANRIKSKGLQKLRWFCQMCRKQCRDQNGFKCHLTSESHQRQLLLVAENTGTYLRQFSKEFEANFMQILKTCFGTKRVRANEVYQEYIKDKGHVHMNSTVWHTLTGFVHYLGSSGKCKIDQNEKGWYIQYIDQEELLRKAEEAKRMKAEKDDEERQQEMINERVRRALEQQGDAVNYQPSELVRNADSEKISINLTIDKKPSLEDLTRPSFSVASVFDKVNTKKEFKNDDEKSDLSRSCEGKEKSSRNDRKIDCWNDAENSNRSRSESQEMRRQCSNGKEEKSCLGKREKSRLSALDEIREQQEKFKEKKNRRDHWLHKGIIVKVTTKKLGENYYKSKGVVVALVSDYVANVKLNDGVLVKLDQSHVETVIPGIGREMKIVNGAYRGCIAKLESLDQDNFSLNLCITEGPMSGRKVSVPYEDASKLA